MPQSSSNQANPDATALDAAFEALNTYDQGSSRGALMPIDEAVRASLDDKAAQKALERQLVAVLKSAGTAVAREYISSKLTLIGSESSVPALAAQLNAPEYATSARNALEAIPGRQTTKALRNSLSKTDGLQKIGVINSLGVRRDGNGIRVLAALLKHEDTQIAGAAAAALGEIGTRAAAKSLRSFFTKAPEAIRLRVADAILTCAERLLATGTRPEAKELYMLLTSKPQPDHVQIAARRGLHMAERGN